MRIAVTMRTANRASGDRNLPAGRPNYLARTIRNLAASGMDVSQLHVFVTEPDASWVRDETDAPIVVHAPDVTRTPNQNGLAQVSVLDTVDADWLLMLEDDLEFCADFLGSVQRWVEAHQTPDVRIYRFFAFRSPLETLESSYRFPITRENGSNGMVGSQAVLLRAADARAMVAWHRACRGAWRPSDDPMRKESERGFDKLIGYWGASVGQTYSLVSRPFFVRHIGQHSSLALRTFGDLNNHLFSRDAWAQRRAA